MKYKLISDTLIVHVLHVFSCFKYTTLLNIIVVFHFWNCCSSIIEDANIRIYTSMQSDPAGFILLVDQLHVLTLISLKMVMDSSKNGSWIIPFKKNQQVKG